MAVWPTIKLIEQ